MKRKIKREANKLHKSIAETLDGIDELNFAKDIKVTVDIDKDDPSHMDIRLKFPEHYKIISKPPRNRR